MLGSSEFRRQKSIFGAFTSKYIFISFRFSDPMFWTVQLGDHNIDIMEDSQIQFSVERIIIHPQFKYVLIMLIFCERSRVIIQISNYISSFLHELNLSWTEFVRILINLEMRFSTVTYVYDAALIKLDRRIVFRDEIRRICLPDLNLAILDNMECVTTGWGRTRDRF